MKAAWKNGVLHLELSKAEAWDTKMALLLARGEGELMSKSVLKGTLSDFTGPLKLALTIPEAPVVKERVYATKADRAKGDGFKCPVCKRADLRYAPTAGKSFHDKDTKGNSERCTLGVPLVSEL